MIAIDSDSRNMRRDVELEAIDGAAVEMRSRADGGICLIASASE